MKAKLRFLTGLICALWALWGSVVVHADHQFAEGWRLPFDTRDLALDGQPFQIGISQGPGNGSHQNSASQFWGFDFNLVPPAINMQPERGFPVRESADGTVTSISDCPNDDCPTAYMIIIHHGIANTPTDYATRYLHLNRSPAYTSLVNLNAPVAQGQIIGYANFTGSGVSSLHRHFDVQQNPPELASEVVEIGLRSKKERTLPGEEQHRLNEGRARKGTLWGHDIRWGRT
ncbi:MAG: M23 family metallopeptidase, partial [Dehalococcoidia bacterium]|nr:M23 family metallopeptidase [Dehalococcoidia bacterium]